VTAVTARVPAKLNLQLSVGPLRGDGYHDLVTVFHAVALFDEVTVAPAERDSVLVSGEGARSVPLGGDNLAARAVAALADAVGPGLADSPGVAIEISKRIPVAAGLAGGSADAAGALVACNEMWHAGLSQAELAEVAGRVGSDVAFALFGGTAVGLGRGEQVTPALTAGTYHWVLAFAPEQLATPDVYAACDRLRADRSARPPVPPGGVAGGTVDGAPGGTVDGGPVDGAAGGPVPVRAPQLSTELLAALRSGDPAAVGPLLRNDLQPAALSLLPRLRQALAAGREHGALGTIVSGSGPTCAFLARDGGHARDLVVALAGAGVCRSVVSVTGPAPGATVVTQPTAGRAPHDGASW
jgi:4-diphosphocytidyl-2-C-methyl-D-erythritol kinase